MNKYMLVVQIVAITFCMIFFWYAFEKTREVGECVVPTVNVTIETTTNINEAVVSHVLLSPEYEQKLGMVLKDRDAMLESVHARFRAELGTWLSVFGLLAILATIMVTTFAFACQQASLKDEKEEINKRVEDIKAELCALGKKLNDNIAGKAENDDAEREVIKSEEVNSDKTADASIDSEVMSELIAVQFECKRFIKLWPNVGGSKNRPEDMFADKVEAGVRVLQSYNKLLMTHIHALETKAIVQKMHLISIYLGKVKRNVFCELFVAALRVSRPLTISDEEIEARLNAEDKKMVSGYYRQLYELQF